jgi:hypothetical protein
LMPSAEKKSVVQRPGANEGGREEEERGSGIATGVTGRLHDRKTVPADPTRDIASTAPPKAATARLPEPPGLSESVADVLHGNMSQL